VCAGDVPNIGRFNAVKSANDGIPSGQNFLKYFSFKTTQYIAHDFLCLFDILYGYKIFNYFCQKATVKIPFTYIYIYIYITYMKRNSKFLNPKERDQSHLRQTR